jgi:ABC-type glycerol-3-phosphate transport system permease component
VPQVVILLIAEEMTHGGGTFDQRPCHPATVAPDLPAGRRGDSPVVIFAAISMVVVPVLVLFLFAQRPITQSLALTGLRG